MTDQKAATQAERAEQFAKLHSPGTPLLLPNVWDAGSAHLVARAGASAIATSSGAVSWAHGVADGNNLGGQDMVASLRRIVHAAGNLPVTVDVENGYAEHTDGLIGTINAVLDAGAVGINLEDSGAPASSPTSPLYTPEHQATRIATARSTADKAGVAMFINARTDVFLFAVGPESERLDDVIARGKAYKSAGANGIFAPGLLDLDALATLASATGMQVNAMWLPGAPSPAELAKAGVTRVSLGTALAQVAYTHAQRAATNLLANGLYTGLEDSLDYATLNSAFSAK